jgi:predicted PurR-regulated permease PerM
MDRPSIVLTLMTGAVLTGSLTIAVFTFGYYGWPTIIAAAIVGFLASWPVAYLVSRRIKRDDPGWDSRKARTAGPVPNPGAPEV